MIYFVRHGDKNIGENYNAELKICDDPLSEKGRGDALRIAEYFRDKDIRKIFVSQYIRTRQTAQPTADMKGIVPIVDTRVNEINNGEWRNMSVEEIEAAFPEVWSAFKRHDRDVKFPDGESGEDVKRRQDSFLEDMKREKGDIMVVTHDGYIRILMCNILGLPAYMRYKFKTEMGCICAIEYNEAEAEWKIVRFNQTV